jgi:four helix bundle protein
MYKHNFKDLKIWKEGMGIAKEIYLLTDKFPQKEQFALTSQLNRSGVSIPSNIAEGSYRTSDKEFSRFLDIALGSSAEAETQLILAEWRNYINKDELDTMIDKLHSLQKMTRVFKERLKS